MKTFFRSRYFVTALLLIVVQQVCVACSTYYIGVAGSAIAAQRLPLLEIGLFFGFIFLAYIPGGVANVVMVKAGNRLWMELVGRTWQTLRNRADVHSDANRERTNALLSAEAHVTVKETCTNCLDVFAVACNIIFNAVAMSVVVTPKIGVVLIGTFVVGVALMYAVNSSLMRMAHAMQEGRSSVVQAIYYGWDNVIFGTERLGESVRNRLDQASRRYFSATERYEWFAMVIANTPVMLSIVVMTLFAWRELAAAPVLIGAYLAILPRTIQLFQYMHAMTMYISRLVVLRTRVRALHEMSGHLEPIARLPRIDSARLRVTRDGHALDPMAILAAPQNILQQSGRYCVSGDNGAGKSSWLLQLKARLGDQAVLVGPGIVLGAGEYQRGSSGQNIRAVVEALLADTTAVIILDEWNANLDPGNYAAVDKLLEQAARNRVIVEAINFTQISQEGYRNDAGVSKN